MMRVKAILGIGVLSATVALQLTCWFKLGDLDVPALAFYTSNALEITPPGSSVTVVAPSMIGSLELTSNDVLRYWYQHSSKAGLPPTLQNSRKNVYQSLADGAAEVLTYQQERQRLLREELFLVQDLLSIQPAVPTVQLR